MAALAETVAVTERFESILAGIAAEDPEARRERWQSMFDRQAGSCAHRLVLFCLGQIGRSVLRNLQAAGVELCCLSDNNPALWGTRISGVEVLRPEDAVRQFGHLATFVPTTASHIGTAVRKQLREMGCRSVVNLRMLLCKYPALQTLDHPVGAHAHEQLADELEQIRQSYDLLSDEPSRMEFCDQLQWRYWMTPEFLAYPPDQGELYFPEDLVQTIKKEVFVDAGAFDGDDIRRIVAKGMSFARIYALEPDPGNFSKLSACLKSMPCELEQKITAWPYALGSQDEQITFVDSHDMSAKVSETGQGIPVQARTLDSLPWGAKPTYIKMDIEGAEMAALRGGAELIRSEMPVLAVCLYHRSSDLWQIPNLIHSIAPGYRYYLRRYAEDCWEQVCYAIPPGRVRNA